ncbi:roadblock/LC7 domain-containing protein [Nonomuraea typhae]|uniref:roadblock/LC7 domain-containing protein n=1 Tax=Nonomuraea typhae TaxID=2603600 RepID=UPI001FE9D841|nr:roadblock/LC7 domain-containing protein [Nonomuraea typhae]
MRLAAFMKTALKKTGRRPSMEMCEQMLHEMVTLRERAPEVSGSVACTVDGLRIACDLAGDRADQTAALSAALLSLSRRMADIAGKGAMEETLVSASAGFAALYPAGPTIVLTVVAEPGTNLGLLRLEGRKTAAALAAIATRNP